MSYQIKVVSRPTGLLGEEVVLAEDDLLIANRGPWSAEDLEQALALISQDIFEAASKRAILENL